MTLISRRHVLALAAAAAFAPTLVHAADNPKEIRIDWATYNPVSMVLQDRGPLGADAGLQQGARIPQCGLDRFRLDRRLGRAPRQDQRQSNQVDLCLFAPR